MPDIVLDYHRRKTPIDHPDDSVTTAKIADGAVTRAKLEYPTVDVSFAYLAAIGKTKGGYHYPTNSYGVGILTSDSFTDKAVDAWVWDRYGGIMGRYVDRNNSYQAQFDSSKATSDYTLRRIVGGTEIVIASESVDITYQYAYLIRLSISGSTLKAYRDSPTGLADTATTLKITATDTSLASGSYGPFTHLYGGGHTEASLAWLRAPSSPGLETIQAIIEYPIKGDGSYENPFSPDIPRELVEVRQSDVSPEEWLAIQANPKGPSGLPLVNRLAVTWGAIDFRTDPATGKPLASTFIVTIYGGNSSYVRKDVVLRHVGWARSKGLKVYTLPFTLDNIKTIHSREKKDRDWLIEPEELAYQVLGREDLEVDAVAKFYEREISLGRVKPDKIVDFDLTMEMWARRANKFKKDDVAKKFKGFARR
ncbi:MAG: hypothetical protein QXQ93_07130 [Ignisphaera sp.]